MKNNIEDYNKSSLKAFRKSGLNRNFVKEFNKELVEGIINMTRHSTTCPNCNKDLIYDDRTFYHCECGWPENLKFVEIIQKPIPPNGNKIHTEEQLSYMEKQVAKKYREILQILHFDLTNHNIQETPERVAKMFVRELFKGCYTEEPKITTFPNIEKMNQMVLVGPIDVKSVCSHHNVSFLGDAYIGYIPNEKLVGLSKFARIVDWFSRRPQIQEELTNQIANYIQEKLSPQGLGVYITAKHLCMSVRGVQQANSFADTCALKGIFLEQSVKEEFMNWINLKVKR